MLHKKPVLNKKKLRPFRCSLGLEIRSLRVLWWFVPSASMISFSHLGLCSINYWADQRDFDSQSGFRMFQIRQDHWLFDADES